MTTEMLQFEVSPFPWNTFLLRILFSVMFAVQWFADRTRSRWFVHFVYIFSAGRCTFVVVAKSSSILLIIFVVALNRYFFTYSVTECVKRFRSLRAMVSHTKVSILPISPIGPKMLSSLCPILTFWRSQGYLECGQSKWSRCGIIHVRVKVQVIVWYWWSKGPKLIIALWMSRYQCSPNFRSFQQAAPSLFYILSVLHSHSLCLF